MTPINGATDIIATGKPQPITATPQSVSRVEIFCEYSNAGEIRIGDRRNVSTVEGRRSGLPMYGGDIYEYSEPMDLNTIWIAGTEGDRITWLAHV